MRAVALMVVALLGMTSVALAQPHVSLDPAPDGSLVLVGSGWRPGQRMVVSVGRDQFPVLADSVGDFEIQTGLVSAAAPPEQLAVHRPGAQITQAAGDQPLLSATPHPFAVLFAKSLMTGT